MFTAKGMKGKFDIFEADGKTSDFLKFRTLVWNTSNLLLRSIFKTCVF